MLLVLNFLQLINIIFFLFFNTLRASVLKLLPIITSKKVLFNSKANFFVIVELTATTPPNALTGSQEIAYLKALIIFFSIETPQGLVFFMIATPSFFLKVFIMERAEKIQIQLVPVTKALKKHCGVAGLKAALEMIDQCGGEVRLPLLSLLDSEKAELRYILEQTGLL